jgi:hypothetical protein
MEFDLFETDVLLSIHYSIRHNFLLETKNKDLL